jgi:hypothetical protein
MIQITPQMRVLVAVQPTDFRRGIDGLARQCRELLRSDPFSGVVFVFCNRLRTSIKLLVYDGQGFWLAQKRFSTGRLRYWPKQANTTCQAGFQPSASARPVMMAAPPAMTPVRTMNTPGDVPNSDSMAAIPYGFVDCTAVACDPATTVLSGARASP